MADVVIDPRTGQTVEVVAPETTDADVDRTCTAALWAAAPPESWTGAPSARHG